MKPLAMLRSALFDARSTQWLAAALLSVFIATAVLTFVLAGFRGRLTEKTPFHLVHLQMAAARQWWTPDASANRILAAWKEKEVFDDARRAQWWDWWFPLAYGGFAALVMVALRRAHPVRGSPGDVRASVPIFVVAAAFFDEIENVFMSIMLTDAETSWTVMSYLATAFASVKWVCFVFVLIGALAAAIVTSRDADDEVLLLPPRGPCRDHAPARPESPDGAATRPG